MNPMDLDGPTFDAWLAAATRCSRCPAVAKTRVTTAAHGKERVCHACAAAIEADEVARRREAVAAPPRPAKPFNNLERVARMCATFGLESPFATWEKRMERLLFGYGGSGRVYTGRFLGRYSRFDADALAHDVYEVALNRPDVVCGKIGDNHWSKPRPKFWGSLCGLRAFVGWENLPKFPEEGFHATSDTPPFATVEEALAEFVRRAELILVYAEHYSGPVPLAGSVR